MGVSMNNAFLCYSDIASRSPRTPKLLFMPRTSGHILTSSSVIAKRGKMVFANTDSFSVLLLY